MTPYIIEPSRAAAAALAKRVVLVCASQVAKTEMLLDLIGHRLDQRPAPIIYVGPTKQFAHEQVEPRIMGLLDGAPTLMAKVARGKRMTKSRKVVAGVPLRLAHAGSSSALKSDPAALALVDELEEMLANVRGQGDPLGLVERRGDTFADFVCVVTSTPRKGILRSELDAASGLEFWAKLPDDDLRESKSWLLWQHGTRHHWCWPCPHCGDYFVPRSGLLRYPDGVGPSEAARVAFVQCPRCGGRIEDRDKAAMNPRGRYVAPGQTIDRDGNVSGEPSGDTATLSYWVSGLASPFVTFGERVRVYLESLPFGDDNTQTAVNGGFGELYAPGAARLADWQQVAKRRGAHHFGEVPVDVVRVTIAIDVQKSSLIYAVRGWGARATSWQLDFGELHGSTDEAPVWTDLADMLATHYDGLAIAIAMIDTGFRPDKPDAGSSNMAYDFCRRFQRLARATKGYATLSAPIMMGKAKMTVPGRRIPVTLPLARLDSDYWKSRVHERLAWPEDQPGAFHLSADATDDYCRQLVSETRTVTPSGKAQWLALSRRNHALDIEAMNEAAGHLLNVARIPVGSVRQTQATDDDLPSVTTPDSAAIAARKRMSGFAARLNR